MLTEKFKCEMRYQFKRFFVFVSFPLILFLDLSGGSQLTLQVQPTEEIKKVLPEQIEAVKTVLDPLPSCICGVKSPSS